MNKRVKNVGLQEMAKCYYFLGQCYPSRIIGKAIFCAMCKEDKKTVLRHLSLSTSGIINHFLNMNNVHLPFL